MEASRYLVTEHHHFKKEKSNKDSATEGNRERKRIVLLTLDTQSQSRFDFIEALSLGLVVRHFQYEYLLSAVVVKVTCLNCNIELFLLL